MSEDPRQEPSEPPIAGGGGVARHAGTVGFFTLCSRIVGLFREAIFAHLFGASHGTDAFLMAFRIPNTFRILVAEGSLTVAFLPVFNETQRQGGDAAAKRLMGQALIIFPSLSAILTGLCIVFAEPLVRLYAGGYALVPGKLELTVELVRLMFPFLILISFVALAMGALNARKRFASSAAAPLLFNLVYIGCMVTLGQIIEPAVFGVAIGVLVGGVAQVILQLVALGRSGLLVRPSFRVGPEMQRVLRLMGPAVIALGVYQFNIIVLNWFASHMSEAAVSYLWYADRLQQLPLGVFGIAIATASLPAFSDAHVDGGAHALQAIFERSMRMMAFIIVPAAIGLWLLAVPVIAVVYQHGRFDHDMVQATALALVAFTVGLPAVSGLRVAGQAFFAIKDTKTPVACGMIGLAVNAALAPWLAMRMGVEGLALAVSISAWLQLTAQLILLRRRIGPLGLWHILRGFVGNLLACLPMVGAVLLIVRTFGSWSDGTTLANMLVLLVAVGAGAASYLAAQAGLGADELTAVKRIVKRKLGRG